MITAVADIGIVSVKFELDIGKKLGKSTPNPDLGKSCEFPHYPWHLPGLNDKYCVYWLITYQGSLFTS